jgi:hemerythrin
MSAHVTWKEYYSVGDPSLDSQHKQIIGIINELYDAMQAPSDQKLVKRLLDRLVGYTMNHFKCEEVVMRQHEYPALAEHKALHDKLRQRTVDLREHADLVTQRDLLHFLKKWWMEHIQEIDKAYAPYLQTAANA